MGYSNIGKQDLNSLVPKTTTVNNKALSSNITLTASDVGALSSYTETDPIFVASPSHDITSGHITILGNTSNINTGDETATTIETKLGVSTTNVTSLSNLTGINTGDQVASTVPNDSNVAGTTVKDALNTLGASGASINITDKFYVDGNLGNDIFADGSMTKPYKTIQACLDMIGQPINHIDAMRTIHIYISDKTSAVESVSGSQTFNGCYPENLTVPCRKITLIGYGVKIGDNGAGSGGGNILKEYSSSRRFGATSSEFRPCLTLVGLAEVRDSHQRLRNGFHVGGNCRTSILTRNFNSIQGDGNNKITIHVAPGQHTYPITVSNYPTTPYIRITVQNTTNYNGTYDITQQIDATTFVATRISGTNANTGIETTGIFFESDSAGASGVTHDSCFINTYMQGNYTCDDGTVNAAAPTAGTEVLYSEGSRFFTGIEGRNILCQRWINTTLAGTNTVSSIAGMNNCSFAGTLSLSTFTYSTDDMGFMSCRFNSAVPITVSSAGQTIRIDAITYKSFRDNGCTWITNTPIIDLLGKEWDSGVWASRPTTCLQTGQMYFDTELKKPFWYNSADTSWYDSIGTIHP